MLPGLSLSELAFTRLLETIGAGGTAASPAHFASKVSPSYSVTLTFQPQHLCLPAFAQLIKA